MNERELILSDGRVLGYTEFGAADGVPLFGFHGTPGSGFMFRLADKIATKNGIRIVAPDRPGFGRSTFREGWTLANCAEDVRELADALGLERFAVAGISGGGPFATACAALLPGRVKVAALVNPLGPINPPCQDYEISPAASLTFRFLPKATPAVFAIFFLGRLLLLHRPSLLYALVMRRAAPPDRAILRRSDVRRNLIDGISEGLRPGIRGAVEEMRLFAAPWRIPFGAIRATTFLWQGTEDRNVPVQAALHLAKLIPNCRLIEMRGFGHYWMFEKMGELLQTIRQTMDGT